MSQEPTIGAQRQYLEPTDGAGRALVERRISGRDVATGQVFAPSSGPTRTEADFVVHVRRTVESDPTARQWHFVGR